MPEQNGLVGPKGNFLLGNFQEFKKDELAFLTRCAQEYREIVPLRMLYLPIYLLLNANHVEYILVAQRQDFVKSRIYKLMNKLLGHGLGMSEGDFWLRQRRLMQPAFHRQRIDAYGQIMVNYTERMLSSWQSGQILDIAQAMLSLNVEIVTKVLFNCDVNDDSEGFGDAVGVVFRETATRLGNVVPIPESIPTPGNLRYLRAIEHLDELVYRIIQERRAKSEDRGDLLSMLLHAQDEDGSGMTDLQLRDEMMGMLAAGFETNAVALSWTWYLLSQHPEVEAKVLVELESTLGGHPPTVASLASLPYMDMVYTEALRLYPPGSLFGREAIKDFELGGHGFPAGTEFWISPWALHHNPCYFDMPEEFRPERWEGDLIKRLPKFAYMPFSHGPRGCIGNVFATMEAKLILATVLQSFHLELASGQVVEPKYALTVRPKYGLQMVLTPR